MPLCLPYLAALTVPPCFPAPLHCCHHREGDVYVGSRWNMLTLLLGLTFLVPVFGLVFAFMSYGTLWTGHYYGI
jgi:hypothetical protein